MLSLKKMKEYYQALLAKDAGYEGIFYVGVKSTGVFCRPSCTARKPKFEQCEFFGTAKQALTAGYRPCKRCRPLSFPNQASSIVQKLVAAIEAAPEKRWREADFKELSVDASTARRQFKKRFGMTFIEYARLRRMGIAMKEIKLGNKVIDAQISSGYESSSGFRDAFTRIIGSPPSLMKKNLLKAAWIDTKLGPMIAIADESLLYLLEFIDRRGLEREIKVLKSKTQSAITPGNTPPLQLIEKELNLYFSGQLKKFTTPILLNGTPFQLQVWQELLKIPYGKTWSYVQLAKAVGNSRDYRAVARANGSNVLSLIIPCHRVINNDGTLGGYGGGVNRKQWLLKHESDHYE